ncbi:PleD family two-component system response regulator [Hydrogenophaga sp.]|uniref:response regulator n=1 Tax=Hydrogenophaga sp. TaxID=1904254 RepID=UPI0035B458B0
MQLAEGSGGKTYRILIIDDEPSTIHVLARTLLDVATLRFAVRGEDALRILREGPQDLVLTDADMPDVSGFEIVQAMRQDPLHQSVPIVMVSSHSAPELRHHALDLGVSEFLTKPVDREVLRRRVLDLLVSGAKAPLRPMRRDARDAQLMDDAADEVPTTRAALLADDELFPRTLTPQEFMSTRAPLAEAPEVAAPDAPAEAVHPPLAITSSLLDDIAAVLEVVERLRADARRPDESRMISGLAAIEQLCSDMTGRVITLTEHMLPGGGH